MHIGFIITILKDMLLKLPYNREYIYKHTKRNLGTKYYISIKNYSTHLAKLPSEAAFEISYRKMLYCSFRMRSRHLPLSHSHQRLQSEEVFDPHSLASSVKTLLEQHPIFKEPETSDTHRIL